MNWRSLISTLAIVGEPAMHRCEKNWRWKNACFVDYDFWMVLGGHGWVMHNEKKCKVARGTTILFRPKDSVEAWHSPDAPLRVFSVHFRMDLPTRKRKALPARVIMHDIAKMEENSADLVFAFEKGSSMENTLAHILLGRLLLQFFLDSRSVPLDSMDLRLKEMCRRIDSDTGAHWEPEVLAREIGISISQFNRRFRALIGVPPTRYIISRRIDRAKTLLLETEMTLKEISSALNYEDIYYFHRQFRQETGTTPTAFRDSSARHH